MLVRAADVLFGGWFGFPAADTAHLAWNVAHLAANMAHLAMFGLSLMNMDRLVTKSAKLRHCCYRIESRPVLYAHFAALAIS